MVVVWIMFFVTIIVLSGIGLGYVDGRRSHRLNLQKEQRRLVEARTKEIEAQNRRAELEYRQALAELERFDRREPGSSTGAGGGEPPPLPPPPAPAGDDEPGPAGHRVVY